MIRDSGRIGIVMPRNVLTGASTQAWRRRVLEEGSFNNVVACLNSKGWVFSEIHKQTLIALVVATKEVGNDYVGFCGPFDSLEQFTNSRNDLVQINKVEFQQWSDSVSFPLLADLETAEIYRQLKKAPKFRDTRDFEFRRIREVESADKKYLDFNLQQPASDIPVLTGASIDFWNPNFAAPYAYLKSEAIPELFNKTARSSKKNSSAFNGLAYESFEDLSMFKARISVRDVTNSVDSRTIIPCLLPPGVTAIETLPTLLRRKGTASDEAFLLGVLASMPFDWIARTAVSLHVTKEILDELPIPEPDVGDKRRLRLITITAQLASVDHRYTAWASEVGVDIGECKTQIERFDIECEIDALVASLYGLSRHQFEHIYKSFHRKTDYSERAQRAIGYLDLIEQGKIE
jgi:hypothetical protein